MDRQTGKTRDAPIMTAGGRMSQLHHTLTR